MLQFSESQRGRGKGSSAVVRRLGLTAFEMQASVASASSCWSYAPLIACARHDLSLRCETMKLLDKAGVSPDVLTCVDEFDPVAASQTAASDCFRITLVDHNALAPHLKTAAPNVTEIVDHHKDMGLHAVSVPLGSFAFSSMYISN